MPTRPSDLREACQLIFGAWVIAAIVMLAIFSGIEDPLMSTNYRYGLLLLFAAFKVVYSLVRFFLLCMLWLGKSWSRWAMLVYLAITWIQFVHSFVAIPLSESVPLAVIAGPICVAIEAYACFLLFSGECAAWFSEVSNQKRAKSAA